MWTKLSIAATIMCLLVSVSGSIGCGMTVDSEQIFREVALKAKSDSAGEENVESVGTEVQEKTANASKKNSNRNKVSEEMNDEANADQEVKLEIATFGNGCYWCTEAVFQRVKGVKKVVSGFMGGQIDNPTYEQVCTGRTGHAEVLQIEFDPKVVSYDKLLEIFWRTHDPTTLNRQGNDVGTQYRSAVFYHNQQQQELADKYKNLLGEARAFNAPIVTEITKASTFYAAPDYHQDYYNQNKKKNPYCGMIQYKLEKFRKAFKDVIDKEKDVVK